MTQKQYYEDLVEGLIENNFDVIGVRSRGAGSAEIEADQPPSFGVGFHLTPTNKRRHSGASGSGDHRAQRACSVCKCKGPSYVCSGCRQTPAGEVIFCGPKTGRTCFEDHLSDAHDVDLSLSRFCTGRRECLSVMGAQYLT